MEEHILSEQIETTPTPVSNNSISLATALRILATVSRNINEPTAFWASKTAYSGVYRTAVKNGWIEDGLFVTDIPEGVDGGFLAADMRRVALMAGLLSDVLQDQLPQDAPAPVTASVQETIDAAVQQQIRAYFSERELDEVLGETIAQTLEELESFKEELEDLKDEILEEIESAKDE